jgi:phosphate/sulfate permease
VLLTTIIVVIVVALVFDWTNGFHDAANAIATSVATRALTPRVALAMAAVMNLVGAFLGTQVASTVGSGIIAAPQGTRGLLVVLAALLGAIFWNLVTWRLGLPSSSSHALIGGLVGAALASAGTVQWAGGWRIMRTIGRRIIDLDPPRGFAAEVTASAVLYTTAFVFAAPISTTQTITSAILGVGATRRLSAVRWGVAGNIAVAWVLTIPAAALSAAAAYGLLALVVG